MAKKVSIEFSTKEDGKNGEWHWYERHIIPDTLKASTLFLKDIKIYSRRGGSDGELDLLNFMYSMGTWTQAYFFTYVEAKENKQAYLHIVYEVEGARAEIK